MGVAPMLAITLLAILVTVEGARLGEQCSYDRDCDGVPQSFCERQQKCTCMKGFKADESNEKCIAMVGAVCKGDDACNTLQYSECRQEVCECQSGYVPHSSETECLPEAVSFRAPCEENLQCMQNLGDGSHCFQEKCICTQQYHPFDNKCFQNIGLGQTCNATHQCYVNEELADKLVCANSKCGCREPYTMDGNSCRGDGHRMVFSLTALFVGLGICRLFT